MDCSAIKFRWRCCILICLRPYIDSLIKVHARWIIFIRPRPYRYRLMTDQSLLHNRRAGADCPHHISTYTLWYTQLDDSSLNWAHVWGSFSHKEPWQFFKLFENVGKVLHAKICDCIPCLLYIFPTLIWSWEPEGLPTPSLISPLLLLNLKMWFPYCSDCQTFLRYSRWHTCHYPWSPVFPIIVTTTNFHVHRLKQILLNCELFLPERIMSGETMINRQWCCN